MAVTDETWFWATVGATAVVLAMVALVTYVRAHRKRKLMRELARHIAHRDKQDIHVVNGAAETRARDPGYGSGGNDSRDAARELQPQPVVSMRRPTATQRPVPQPRPVSLYQYKSVNIHKAWGSPNFGFTLGGGQTVAGQNMPSQLVVEQVDKGSDAAKQGMVAGDHIVNVDGQNMYGITQDEALDMLINSADVVVQLQAPPDRPPAGNGGRPVPVPRARTATLTRRTSDRSQISPTVKSAAEVVSGFSAMDEADTDAVDLEAGGKPSPDDGFSPTPLTFLPSASDNPTPPIRSTNDSTVPVQIRALSTGRTYTYEAEGTATVLLAKYFMKAHLSIPASRQMMMYRGRTLADDFVLCEDAGIADGGVINLIDAEEEEEEDDIEGESAA